MATRIYLWKPSSVTSFGHIAMELSDGTYVSWWPENEDKDLVKLFVGTEAKCYDKFVTELKKNGNPDKTLNVCDMNEEKIKAFFKKLQEDPKWYHVMKSSCATVIYNALCEGADWFKGLAGETTTPEAVAALVEAYVNGQKDAKGKGSSFGK